MTQSYIIFQSGMFQQWNKMYRSHYWSLPLWLLLGPLDSGSWIFCQKKIQEPLTNYLFIYLFGFLKCTDDIDNKVVEETYNKYTLGVAISWQATECKCHPLCEETIV